MSRPPRLLYCHCAHAQILPKEVKEAVLRRLCQAGLPFEAAADLCEMSARRDPALRRFPAEGPLKIAACYPRAVKGLFAAAGAPLSLTETEVLNMRTGDAEEILEGLLQSGLRPNLPPDKAVGESAGPTSAAPSFPPASPISPPSPTAAP